MSKNRYYPFGYEMENGKVTVNLQKSKLVFHIFEDAICGMSLSDIAKKCNLSNIPYSETKSIWTKHMVRRILENKKYYEDTTYPALISQNQFERAYKMRTGKMTAMSHELKLLRKYLACNNCFGKLLIKKTDDKCYKFICDKCKTESMPMSIEELHEKIALEIGKIFKTPEIIKPPIKSKNELPMELIRLHQEIKQMLGNPAIHSDTFKHLILKKVSAQYDICDVGDFDPATLLLKEISLNNYANVFDEDLFIKTVATVLVSPQSIVTLQLINGQII